MDETSSVEAQVETTPLVKRGEFREVSQPREESPGVEICGINAPCLVNVPVVKTIWKKRSPEQKGTFSSSLGVLLSMLGSVVGTGNIWRYPRIVANNAAEGGALAFILVWFMFLWLWSMPIMFIENGVGRFTKKSTVESYAKLLGPSYRFFGGFQAFVGFCLGSYYSVLVGWCGYYFVHTCAQSLPSNLTSSTQNWDTLEGSIWIPTLCHGLSILIAALSVSRGVSTIEPVNRVIVPVLLLIVVFCFYWALFLPYASEGITHMFSPNWASLKTSDLWLDAISQNAWDTGAGLGTFLTYASFMRRDQGAVKLGFMTPFFNNVVSLMCGILVFATVFSVQRQEGKTIPEIVTTLQYNGPGNTGLTFIWMPLLFGSIGGGRFLAVIFFLCLTFAGISSLIALMEMPIHVLGDFGMKRLPATIIVGLGMFSLGAASAIDSKILVNQDSVWAYALILSGCLMVYVVLRYGIFRFRKTLYLDYGIGDWPLPLIWVFVVMFILPIEGIGLIIWWIVETIINNSDWWQINEDSLAVVLVEWAVGFLIFIGLNWWMMPLTVQPPRSKFWRKVLGVFIKFTPAPSKQDTVPPPSFKPTLDGPPPSYDKYNGYGSAKEEEPIPLSPRQSPHPGKKKYGSAEDPSKLMVSDIEL